jgi:hypothetical protein
MPGRKWDHGFNSWKNQDRNNSQLTEAWFKITKS